MVKVLILPVIIGRIFRMPQKFQITLEFKLHDLFLIIYGIYESLKCEENH